MTKARDLANAGTALTTVSATELGYLDGVTSAVQTQVDAKIAKTLTTTTGDIIYASSANTPARLGIGTAAQVLTVNSGATAPEWATPASGGGMTVLASGSLSGSTLSLTSISGSYKNLQLVLRDFYTSAATPFLRFNSDANNNYADISINRISGSNTFVGYSATEINVINQGLNLSDNNNALVIDIFDYTNTSAFKMCQGFAITDSNSARGTTLNMVFGTWRSTAAITGVSLPLSSGTYSGGTYILYGVN